MLSHESFNAAENEADMGGTGMKRGFHTSPANQSEWCCTQCGKKLGVELDGRVYVRFARGHQYCVSLPATCVCRGCGALSELREAKPVISVPEAPSNQR